MHHAMPDCLDPIHGMDGLVELAVGYLATGYLEVLFGEHLVVRTDQAHL